MSPKSGPAATLLVSSRTALILEREIDGETTTFECPSSPNANTLLINSEPL